VQLPVFDIPRFLMHHLFSLSYINSLSSLSLKGSMDGKYPDNDMLVKQID